MRKGLVVLVFAALLCGQATVAHGAGFLIYEHGAAAMAMAGAFVGLANNPSAIWHNPAGIAFLRGTQFSLGTTLIWPSSTMTLTNWPFPQPAKTWKQESQMFYPSTVYFTQSLGERITLGFGFFSPFGLGAKWPKENQLRYLGYEDDMKTFFFNPTIGVKLTDQLAFGFGVSYIYSTVKFKLVEVADFGAFGSYDLPAELSGNGDAWGFNAGLLYKTEKFGVGLNYRSRFDIDFKGDLTFDKNALPAPFRAFVPDGAEGETTFKFPDIVGVGVSFTPTEKLLLTVDAHYVLWSRFDEYVVTFTNPPLDPLETIEDWNDAWTFRGGIQYQIHPKIALRGGVLFDQTPQTIESMDPLLPDANRTAFTAGLGFNLAQNIVLDLAFQREIFGDRTSPNRSIYQVGSINIGESLYETTANLFALSLSFGF